MVSQTQDGPLQKWLAITGKKIDDFRKLIQEGDPAATSILGAETIFSAIRDLQQTVEAQAMGMFDEKKKR